MTGALVRREERPEVNRIDIDRLERRYRLVYPLNIFLENARQVVVVSAVGLVVGAAVYFLHYALSSADKAPIEIQVFLVTAFACAVVVGYISLWALTVRNFWKLGALLTLVLALALGLVALRDRHGGRLSGHRYRDEAEGGRRRSWRLVARRDRLDRGLFCSLDLDIA